MARASFYIDGFNLYHAINDLDKPHLKWLDLKKLAVSFLSPESEVVGVSYFTAHMHWNPTKSLRHRAYVDALESVGVDVHISNFAKRRKYCHRTGQYCKNFEEKQTDVAMALQVSADLARLSPDIIYLVTADSDYVPLIKHIRSIDAQTKVVIAAPPGRLTLARELCGLADDKKEITAGRLGACLLPRNVEDENGKVVARRPAKYSRP